MKNFLTIIFLAIIFIQTADAATIPEQEAKAAHLIPAQSSLLSLNFTDIPVRDLLILLAQYQGENLILSDAVTGNLTLHLDNITWEQALDTVLTMQNLAKRKNGSILFIAPATDMSMAEQQTLEIAPLNSALIPVHYAKAVDLGALLSNQGGVLSERGQVTVDERTNQLWVKDTAANLAQVRRLVRSFDIPAKQVQIAARIVNVDQTSATELGLKFGTVSENNTLQSGGSVDQLHMDMPLTVEDVGHFTIAIAKLGNGGLLDLELSALEREGRAKIVSNPELITSNRQPAVIESGQEIPYQESTSSGATNVAFKKAVLSLKVTPEITPENRILLTLTVNQDKVDNLTVNGVPAISTQQVQSQVMLNNGETIVLGGIYEQSNSHVVERVPFWSSIPVLGKLFTNKENRAERKELLIFVTPKIVAS